MNLFDKADRGGKPWWSGRLRYIPILVIVFLLALGGGLRGGELPGEAMETEGGAETSPEDPAMGSRAETETEGASDPAAGEAPVSPAAASFAGTEAAKLTVYVCGYVRYPGVYEVEAPGRVLDGVNAAGGFLDEADTEYWNLAEPLTDGEQIRIPSREESRTMEAREPGTAGKNDSGGDSSGGSDSSGSGGPVDLNTAGVEELMTLNGIGASRAAAIVAYREENGPFRSIEEIMNVSGIKEASFAKIKDYISVGR